MNAQEPPPPNVWNFFAIAAVIIGLCAVIISRLVNWPDGVTVGFSILGVGIPYLLWRLYVSFGNLHIISILLFMRKEKLLDVSKGKEKNKKLISERFQQWAQKVDDSAIKVKGVTLNLVFGNTGLLQDLMEDKKLKNPGGKKIQALLLNPYSMNAITRSIQESRPFDAKEANPVDAICKQTLKKHKTDILYKDFCITVDNIRDLMGNTDVHKLTIECRIYSTFEPSFLIIDDEQAISENLILGRKENDKVGKLYGILPHLIYTKGDIKKSLENHFDYIWQYDSVPLEDFHENVEEKNYEINRLFLLYNVQKNIWNREWEQDDQAPGRSLSSVYDTLYQVYKEELYPNFTPRRILDLGCGDGGGGSMRILKDYPDAKITFNDISDKAIGHFIQNAKNDRLDYSNANWVALDMLTFLNHSQPDYYALIYANFSIIYMTKIKAIEIFRQIFICLQKGGVFMLSVWTNHYFDMPIGEHGTKGHRPPYEFMRIPMTEDLQVLVGGSEDDKRLGEIRRFYRGIDELIEEFESADDHKVIDFENINYRYYENDAVLRVWLNKKK
jgi:SAM-dependent methyltransferase